MSQPGQVDFATVPLNQLVATMRIIVFALAMGLLSFTCVAYFALGPAEEPDGDPIMTAVGLAIGAAMLVGHPMIAGAIRRRALSDLPDDETQARGRLLAAYQVSLIVSCALLEGPGFLNVMVYAFIEGHWVSLAMVGLLLAAILTKFPSEGGVTDWLDRQFRDARDRAALG